MNKTSEFPPSAADAEAGLARKGSAAVLCPSPSSAPTPIDGAVELVDGDDAGEIRDAYRQAMQEMARGLRAVIICGSILISKKSKHGQFLTWLERNCPEIPRSTAYRWMDLATRMGEALQISHNGKFDGMLIHNLLQLPEPEITDEQRELRHKAIDLMEGKTQVQLMLEFRDFTPARQGGDNEYLAFCQERHQELLRADGRPPKRRQEFAKEFADWQLKRMNPKARAEHVLMIANRAADYAASGMRLALMENSLFRCSKDRLHILWDLNQKLNKVLRDARGGRDPKDDSDTSD